MQYQLRVAAVDVRIGHFVLGTMRVERDVQYWGLHLKPLGKSYVQPELQALADNMARLPAAMRRRHLGLVNAASIAELRGRLAPDIRVIRNADRWVAHVEQVRLDGRTRLKLELSVPAAQAQLTREGDVLRMRARSDGPLDLSVRVTTTAPALTPLTRAAIFDRGFLAFLDSMQRADAQRARRLERQVRGFELLASREKLMAGLPNYATYFGRDMLVTALLMQPIWSSTTSEHVIASVLRKLSARGEVSHEEALAGQAIRERAAEYNQWVAKSEWTHADAVLKKLAQVRENYAMIDDEFQLPVLAAKYLADSRLTDARKRAFLMASAGESGSANRLTKLLSNLALVADLTAAYVREPVAKHLVPFPTRPEGGYAAASWRDSNVGYGGGRFAMDVNVVWAPHALASIRQILAALRALGFTTDDLQRAHPALRNSVLGAYIRDASALQRAIETWRGSARHFRVELASADAHARVDAKLASLPAAEAHYWRGVVAATAAPADGIEFLALSLDETGAPIPIANTDIATRWFLDDITESVLSDPARADHELSDLRIATLHYPRGLHVDRLGPLVANDAFATPAIWAAFRRDEYHSPKVVWGREVNLLLLGLMRQIEAAYTASGELKNPALARYVTTLEAALRQVSTAVEASGLKHNEVWSYRIENGKLVPIRWGGSTDVQLWNLTNLVVQYQLARSAR